MKRVIAAVGLSLTDGLHYVVHVKSNASEGVIHVGEDAAECLDMTAGACGTLVWYPEGETVPGEGEGVVVETLEMKVNDSPSGWVNVKIGDDDWEMWAESKLSRLGITADGRYLLPKAVRLLEPEPTWPVVECEGWWHCSRCGQHLQAQARSCHGCGAHLSGTITQDEVAALIRESMDEKKAEG